MSSPSEFYRSLPPVIKTYGTVCFMVTVGYQLGLIPLTWIYLDFALVGRKFQIWRLLTNFFFLGGFSIQFAVRLLMLARYGVELEKTYVNRTADFLWMIMISMTAFLAVSLALPFYRLPFLSGSLVFMLLYLWSREFPTAKISLMGVLTLQGLWMPFGLLAINVMMGGSILSDVVGIVVGHAYYFLTILHPRVTGRHYLQTPAWVHNLVGKWTTAGPPAFSPPPPPSTTGAVYGLSGPVVAPTPVAQGSARSAFTGRSYRLNQ